MVCCLSRIVFLSFKWKLNKSFKLSKFDILQDWNILSWVFYHQLLTWSALETPLTKRTTAGSWLRKWVKTGGVLEWREARTRIHLSLPQFLSQRVCLAFILITDRKENALTETKENKASLVQSVCRQISGENCCQTLGGYFHITDSCVILSKAKITKHNSSEMKLK